MVPTGWSVPITDMMGLMPSPRSHQPVGRERLLIRILLELADTMAADHDMVDFFYLLCERAVHVVPADAAGVLLMNGVGDLEVAAASSSAVRELEQLQVECGQGPCVESHRTGDRVEEGDLAGGRNRWPNFATRALARGLNSVHARPLRWRGQPIGALNVFRTTEGRLSDEDAAVVAGLADMAAIGINHHRAVSTAEQQVVQLQRALDKRAVVDQAVAVLADRLGVDHGAAFHWLRRYARNHNQRLRDVAQRFLHGEIDMEALTPS